MISRSMRTLAAVALCLAATSAWATPSTVFWTPATTYTQPFLVPHLTYDTYFGESGSYPIITGITIGLLPYDAVQAEVGFDLTYGYPGNLKGESALLLNGKVTLVEGKLADWSPGLSLGIYNLGVKKDVTDANTVYAVLSKGVGSIGTVAAGYYYGLNDKLYLKVDGGGNLVKGDRGGLIASWTSTDVTLNKPYLNKVNFFADVQTGKNFLGAVGGGVGLYFTPAVDLLAGPVFFLEDKVQPGASKVLWSLQLDVDFDFNAK